MKRGLLRLGILLFGGCLLACTPTERLDLSATETVETVTALDEAGLATKIAAGDSFALLISSDWCSTCQDFAPLLDEIIVSRQIVIYEIVLEDGFATDNPYVPYQSTPTFVIWKDGAVLVKIDAVADEGSFESVRAFETFLQKWVILK